MINRKQDKAYAEWLMSLPCAWPGCQRQAEHLHHEPPIGMGRNKKKIPLIGAVVQLCLHHHIERHNRACGSKLKNELRKQARDVYPMRFLQSTNAGSESRKETSLARFPQKLTHTSSDGLVTPLTNRIASPSPNKEV